MKSVILGVGFSACLLLGLFIVQQQDATADQATVEQVSNSTTVEQAPNNTTVEQYGDCVTEAGSSENKCSFNSDCKYGKCSKGKCGACGFTSECNGWGKCSKGQCGACGFDSECKGFGKCSKGKCTKSPY